MFYVFNVNTVGFIIVAGDDTVTPILGYSDSIYILQIQTDKGLLTKKLIITK